MDAKKKAIISSVVFTLVIGLVVGIINLIAYLTTTNNHNETRFGIYKIHMVGWEGTTGRQFTNWARETLPQLNRLGPTFQLVDSGEDIQVVRLDAMDNINQCAQNAGIAYQADALGHRRIVIDPVCVRGELEFKTAFMHEIGHSLGMDHVCRANETRNDCSPVGRGIAVMNPNLSYESTTEDVSTATVGPLPTWELQPLDFSEFCRNRHCERN